MGPVRGTRAESQGKCGVDISQLAAVFGSFESVPNLSAIRLEVVLERHGDGEISMIPE